MGRNEIREVYQEFTNRFSLPEFSIIDKELEVSLLDANKFLLRKIVGKIKDKLIHYAEIIEDLLQPDASFASMHECTFLTEKAKIRFFELYKKLMFLIRTSDILYVERSTVKEARFVVFFFDHLPKIKKEMKAIIKLRINSWRKELSEDVKVEYFG